MPGRVVFIEVEGGSDKGADGHRPDTMPMVEELKKRGWDATTIFYHPDHRHDLFRQLLGKADAYVSRVNPGNLPGSESTYMEMLRYLSAAGLVGMSTPDTMEELGAKDALCKLVGTGLALPDTFAYYDRDALREGLPRSLAHSERVLKQNRGSTGTGIWHVKVIDERSFSPDEPLPPDTRLKCVEAVDNHVEEWALGDFMTFCEQYIDGELGMLVDMRFLPRIKEGEVRILLVGSKPIFVVHKKPADSADAFSATLFSGATYSYDPPEEWPELVEMFTERLPTLTDRLGHDAPLIWTADFILDTDEEGKDRYVLGELNCSCVGFTSHLHLGIQGAVAEEIISVVSNLNPEVV